MASVREERNEKFIKEHLDLISLNYDIEFYEHSHRYTIYSTPFGDLDFYPKSNKVLIRKDNKWIKPGLNWIYRNLRLE